MKVSVWATGLAAGFLLAGCKTSGKTKDPGQDVRSWTLAEIEAELQRNDQALASEGIMVASASIPTPPVTQPGSEQAAPEEQEELEADDGGEAREPGPEPTPNFEPAPDPAPEIESFSDDYAPETTSRAPERAVEAEEAPYDRRRRGRRSSSRKDAKPSRCERVCDLAEATCDLETQICELALRHPDEPRYEQACLRAEQQCVAAERACDRCEE